VIEVADVFRRLLRGRRARRCVGPRHSARSDAERLERPLSMAVDLFGPAYEVAGEGQRWTWIDMCERALLDVEKRRRAPG
jgi:hypothetical protein